MRTFIKFTACILFLLHLYSCNGDIFIDDFRPSETDLTLDGNGDVATIHFASSEWDLLELYIYDDSFNHQFKMYDLDERLITSDQYPYLKGLGKIVCDESLTDFTIERSNPKEVKITVGENVRHTHFQFKLVASNEYEMHEIYIDITPSDRYEFDHITYSLNAYYGQTIIKEKQSIVQSNHRDNPYPCLLIVQGLRHEVEFKSDTPEAFQLLADDNLTVEIPSKENGHLDMNGAQAKYISEQQAFPFPDTEREITIPAHTTQIITLMQEYEWFETEYTLYAIHPKTKKQRIITGTLESSIPAGNYIKRENIY